MHLLFCSDRWGSRESANHLETLHTVNLAFFSKLLIQLEAIVLHFLNCAELEQVDLIVKLARGYICITVGCFSGIRRNLTERRAVLDSALAELVLLERALIVQDTHLDSTKPAEDFVFFKMAFFVNKVLGAAERCLSDAAWNRHDVEGTVRSIALPVAVDLSLGCCQVDAE